MQPCVQKFTRTFGPATKCSPELEAATLRPWVASGSTLLPCHSERERSLSSHTRKNGSYAHLRGSSPLPHGCTWPRTCCARRRRALRRPAIRPEHHPEHLARSPITSRSSVTIYTPHGVESHQPPRPTCLANLNAHADAHVDHTIRATTISRTDSPDRAQPLLRNDTFATFQL